MTDAPCSAALVAFAQQMAEDIAGEMGCPEPPPCCDDCACWKEAIAHAQ